LERGVERREDRGHVLLGAPADRPLRGGEGLEERRVRLLKGLRHDADGAHDAIDHPGPVAPRRLQVPGRLAGRDAPVAALIGEQVLGPGLLDDAEALLEGGPVGGVELVVLVGEGAVDARAAALDVGAAAGRGQVEERDLHALGRPTSRRAMTMRWIWPVPSTMSIALTSRYSFST